ncbi:hypothetical protein I8748_15605 [Nostoc sp. CENA67]|uniref:Uncharacterized protein n=1 Tax=Amazonocrinis nigriterrae CENA67 TaxID=2794033 RepID=A0A8J7HTP3_9NOST|nr:hypothetical protein [Amazonocrinis nigriterrae]MBH8563598.1 hypothetical protein [Amazonocrinis nigriterrae CENA67]
MKKLLFALVLLTFTTFGIVLSSNVDAQLPQNNIRQINYAHEAPVDTQPSSGLPRQNQLLATVLASQEQKTQLINNPSTPTQVNLSLSTPIQLDWANSPGLTNAKKRYVLEVQVSSTGRPVGNYSVYLNLPNLKAASDVDTYYIGPLNFFEPLNPKDKSKTFQFDLTEELIQQVKKGEQPTKISNLTLTFLPDEGGGPEVFVDRLSLREL